MHAQSLDELASWMTGSFNSKAQSEVDTNYFNIHLEMVQIWEEEKNGKWLYVEQAASWALNRPYRQRIYHLKKISKKKYSSTVYMLPEPDKFIYAWKNPELFNELNPSDIEEKEGCTIFLKYKKGKYSGSTVKDNCPSNLRGASYATSIVDITPELLSSWDQGFDQKGEQVWGAEKGPYLFVKYERLKPEDFKAPDVERSDQIDDYFGTKISDPYRWLEDETSASTKKWVTDQNEASRKYLDQFPYRNEIKDRLTEIWDYKKVSVPWKKAGNYFMYKNDGLEQQRSLYWKKKGNGVFTKLIDGNALSNDGTVSLSYAVPDKSGKYVAYAISEGGSDWKIFKVLDLTTGDNLEDELNWIKFSGISWYKDGFFYTRYDQPGDDALSVKNEGSKVYYHKIGTAQSDDILIYEDAENPRVGNGVWLSEDESYMFLGKWYGTHGEQILFRKTSLKNEPFKMLCEDKSNNYWVLDNKGNNFYIYTDYNAPNYRVVKVDGNRPDPKNWKDIIPEKNIVLDGITLSDGKLIAEYLKDVQSVIEVYNYKGQKLHSLELPDKGIVSKINGEKEDDEVFYRFESFLYPPTIFTYNVNENKSEVYEKVDIDFNAEDYESKQVFYESKDGTKIPMFIVHKKGIELNGNNPTMLYGYGGFNISYTPRFDVSRLYFLEQGGVYCVANLRGGGEYGETWHKAGMLEKKQNVFDDFIAACEYLVDEKYTNKDKLAVIGRSNGGLLIGAVMTQRPDLFKVALPVVGVMDMLRYHTFTIGHAWAVEYGSSENEEQFNYLIKYSPLHNIKAAEYPATMVLTADRDDRVVPAHSYKFVSELQYQQKGDLPTLIRIGISEGHGSGKSTEQLIEEYTDIWTFVSWHLGMKE